MSKYLYEENREKETKAERRARRKMQMDSLLTELHHDDMNKGFLVKGGNVFQKGVRVMKRGYFDDRREQLAELASMARQGLYTDEFIGIKFRELVKDF